MLLVQPRYPYTRGFSETGGNQKKSFLHAGSDLVRGSIPWLLADIHVILFISQWLKHFIRYTACVMLSDCLWPYRNLGADRNDISQLQNICIIHSDTAMTDFLSDRGRVVRAMNAIVRFGQAHPEGAVWPSGIGLFIDDRIFTGRCSSKHFANSNRIRSNDNISIQQI
jgi:hypothetical protein